MLTNDELTEFAVRYAGDRSYHFRRWFDQVMDWAGNRDIEAEACCISRPDSRTFFIRFRLSDSKGAFYASVFPHQGPKRKSVEAECSDACARARRDRMRAMNGRIAARVA